MSVELQLQTAQSDFLVSPTFLQSLEYTELRLKKQKFIDDLLKNRPRETIEDVGSVVHETQRIPDPRILIIRNGQILTLFNDNVDTHIEKTSYLGELEYRAFQEIKKWANTEADGAEVWFSAPFPGVYPVSKIDLGEIAYSSDKKTKVLLKKAILLDIDSEALLTIANNFAAAIGAESFSSTEELRSRPFFCTQTELNIFYEMVSIYTDQVDQIKKGDDLKIKLNTYQRLTTIHQTIYSSGQIFKSEYYNLRRAAEEQGLVGDKSESCPVGSQTAFQAMSGGLEAMHGKFVKNCGNCGKPINAFISKGYRCTCGGVYEGC
jgi:hypothetical protein